MEGSWGGWANMQAKILAQWATPQASRFLPFQRRGKQPAGRKPAGGTGVLPGHRLFAALASARGRCPTAPSAGGGQAARRRGAGKARPRGRSAGPRGAAGRGWGCARPARCPSPPPSVSGGWGRRCPAALRGGEPWRKPDSLWAGSRGAEWRELGSQPRCLRACRQRARWVSRGRSPQGAGHRRFPVGWGRMRGPRDCGERRRPGGGSGPRRLCLPPGPAGAFVPFLCFGLSALACWCRSSGCPGAGRVRLGPAWRCSARARSCQELGWDRAWTTGGAQARSGGRRRKAAASALGGFCHSI